jgi:hypothetical protein
MHSVEDDRFVFVDEHAVFEVQTHGFAENQFFQTPSFAQQVGHGVPVADPPDLLVDDGTVVEDGSDIVGGGADQLHAASMGLMVRAGPGEGWQEGMVNVDDRAADAVEEIRAEDLHVAGQHDQIDLQFPEEGELLFLDLLFPRGLDGQEMEGHTVVVGRLLEGAVVRDQSDHVGGQLALTPVEQQFVAGVGVLGNEDGDPRPPLGQGDAYDHAEFVFRVFTEGGGLRRGVVTGRSPFHPLEEGAGGSIVMLIGVNDSATVAEDPAGDTGDQARAVGTVEQSDEAGRSRVAGHSRLVVAGHEGRTTAFPILFGPGPRLTAQVAAGWWGRGWFRLFLGSRVRNTGTEQKRGGRRGGSGAQDPG